MKRSSTQKKYIKQPFRIITARDLVDFFFFELQLDFLHAHFFSANQGTPLLLTGVEANALFKEKTCFQVT